MMHISIQNASLITIAGNHITDLATNVLNNICGPTANQSLTAHAHGEAKQYPLYLAPIPKYENSKPTERLTNILRDILSDMLTSIAKNKKYNRILLHTTIPPTISNEFIFSRINNLIPTNVNITCTASNYNTGVCLSLAAICSKLTTNEFDAVIFGGIDSLINPQTIKKLDDQKRLRTKFCSYGIVPGEAAGYIVLDTQKSDKNLGSITAISYAESLTNLHDAIQQVLNETATDPTNIDSVILSLGAEPNDAITWYQTTQETWSNQKLPIPNEITTYQSLGEIGAATVPISIILGCKIADNCKKILVCETNDNQKAGAILISGEKNA